MQIQVGLGPDLELRMDASNSGWSMDAVEGGTVAEKRQTVVRGCACAKQVVVKQIPACPAGRPHPALGGVRDDSPTLRATGLEAAAS